MANQKKQSSEAAVGWHSADFNVAALAGEGRRLFLYWVDGCFCGKRSICMNAQ